MRVALDTNRTTDLLLGDAILAARLEGCEQVCIPLPVLAELKSGFRYGSRRVLNDAALLKLLSKPNVVVIVPTTETAEHYADLYVQLRRAGRPIPTNDLWLAAQCLEHGLILITRDAHFNNIPQLIQG